MPRTKWGGVSLTDALIIAYYNIKKLRVPYPYHEDYIDLVPQAFWLAWLSYNRSRSHKYDFRSYLYQYFYYYFMSYRKKRYRRIVREKLFDYEDPEMFFQEIETLNSQSMDLQRRITTLLSFHQSLNEDGKWALITILENSNIIIGYSTYGFRHYIRSTVREIWMKQGGWSRWKCDKVMKHMSEVYLQIYETETI